METVVEFLKHSTVLDLLVILLVVLSFVILILGGIGIAIASRTRTPLYFFLMAALLPVLLALLGTYLRFKGIERAIGLSPDVSPEVVAASRQEAWITTYLGAAGSAILGLIGLTGLVLKKQGKT